MKDNVVQIYKIDHPVEEYIKRAGLRARNNKHFAKLEYVSSRCELSANDILANKIQEGFFGDTIAVDFIKWIRSRISLNDDFFDASTAEAVNG